jgi:hypothetical protein
LESKINDSINKNRIAKSRKCNICEKSFSITAALKKHIIQVHFHKCYYNKETKRFVKAEFYQKDEEFYFNINGFHFHQFNSDIEDFVIYAELINQEKKDA